MAFPGLQGLKAFPGLQGLKSFPGLQGLYSLRSKKHTSQIYIIWELGTYVGKGSKHDYD